MYAVDFECTLVSSEVREKREQTDEEESLTESQIE